MLMPEAQASRQPSSYDRKQSPTTIDPVSIVMKKAGKYEA